MLYRAQTPPPSADNHVLLPCLLLLLSCRVCYVCHRLTTAGHATPRPALRCASPDTRDTMLLWWVRQGVFRMPQPGDQQSGVEASCGAALKDVLIRVFRHSNSELFKPWRQQLHQALDTMGATAAAASVNRHLDRQAARWEQPAGTGGKARPTGPVWRHTPSRTLSVLVTFAWQTAQRTVLQAANSTTVVGGCQLLRPHSESRTGRQELAKQQHSNHTRA